MRIHTDTLTKQDLWAKLPDGCDLEVTSHGSRKRDHAFEVKIEARRGTDAHGIKRAYARNTGNRGADTYYPSGYEGYQTPVDEWDRAATWVEWGDWMVELFKLDPRAIIGPYDGPDEFVRITQEYAPHRPARENAEAHADRWSTDLLYSRQETAAERNAGEIARVLP